MKKVLLYTMKSCPFCQEIKGLLKEKSIDYTERDIDTFKDEYSRFVKKTKNDYLPAFTLLTLNENTKQITNLEFLVPDDSFKDLNEAVNKVNNFLLD